MCSAICATRSFPPREESRTIRGRQIRTGLEILFISVIGNDVSKRDEKEGKEGRKMNERRYNSIADSFSPLSFRRIDTEDRRFSKKLELEIRDPR